MDTKNKSKSLEYQSKKWFEIDLKNDWTKWKERRERNLQFYHFTNTEIKNLQ